MIGCLAPRQQTGVDKDALAAGYERIDLRIADQIDLDETRIEARRAEDRCDPDPDITLYLCISDQAAIFRTAILRSRRTR